MGGLFQNTYSFYVLNYEVFCLDNKIVKDVSNSSLLSTMIYFIQYSLGRGNCDEILFRFIYISFNLLFLCYDRLSLENLTEEVNELKRRLSELDKELSQAPDDVREQFDDFIKVNIRIMSDFIGSCTMLCRVMLCCAVPCVLYCAVLL